MEQRLFVVTGIMASGKSTVSELLAKRFPKAVHLRGDIFRRMVVSGREEMRETPPEEAVRQLDLRYRLAAMAAKEYYRAGFTVVAQDNFLGDRLPYFVALLKPLEASVVALNPSAEAVKAREAGRNKTGYTGFTVEGLRDAFLRETPRIGLWLDNSSLTAEETVEEILRHYNE